MGMGKWGNGEMVVKMERGGEGKRREERGKGGIDEEVDRKVER